MERKNVDIPSLTNYVVYGLLVRGARDAARAPIIKINWKVMITVLRNSLYHYCKIKNNMRFSTVVDADKKQKLLLEKHKDIARIDQDSKRTHGWYVRVRFLGRTHSKFFSDRKCGGRYSSLLSAISWRDQTEKKLGKVRTNKHMVTVSNSGTGVVGVRHNEKLNRYEVSWVTAMGKQGKTSVSIRKHGKKAAFERACSIRKKRESDRLGYNS